MNVSENNIAQKSDVVKEVNVQDVFSTSCTVCSRLVLGLRNCDGVTDLT